MSAGVAGERRERGRRGIGVQGRAEHLFFESGGESQHLFPDGRSRLERVLLALVVVSQVQSLLQATPPRAEKRTHK